MRKKIDVVVVLPVGPNVPVSYVTDTMESFRFYSSLSHQFILADDSHQGTGTAVQQYFPDCIVLPTARPMGGWAGLYANEATAFRYAVLHYDFKALLKLDTDALVIGPDPEKEMLELMEKKPMAGMVGQYPCDYHGKPWDLGWPRDRILNGSTTWKYIKRPMANWYLRKYYLKAKANGYTAGESVFGGAYFISYNCLAAMLEEGVLPHQKLQRLNLGEDHIFSLLTKAVGYELGTLCTAGQPFALAWKGLPASPEQLQNEGRKIIHSTRYWNNLKEDDIRAFFRTQRKAVNASPSSSILTTHG